MKSLPVTAPDLEVTVVGGKQRLEYIDVLRALAAVAVFALHARAFWVTHGDDGGLTFIFDRIAAQGASGVDLFIVLSGFCMTYPLVRGGDGRVASIDTKRFWRRRMVRLGPAYYASLALVTAMILVPDLQRRLVADAVDLVDVIEYALFVQPFDGARVGAINGPLWSISLEITLYLTFPLTLATLRRFGWTRLIAASVALAAGWFAATHLLERSAGAPAWTGNMKFWLPAHFFEFVLGMLAAYLMCNPRARQTRTAAQVLPIAALVGAVGTIQASETVRIFGWGVAAFCLVLTTSGVTSRPSLAPVAGAAAKLGLVSYSFYLLHQPCILLTASAVRSLGLPAVLEYPVLLPGGVAAMAAVAYGFFRIAERPFLVRGGMRDAIRADPRALIAR